MVFQETPPRIGLMKNWQMSSVRIFITAPFFIYPGFAFEATRTESTTSKELHIIPEAVK